MNPGTTERITDANLPRKTELVVRGGASILAFTVVASYSWLNIWMGFNTLILLVVGQGASKLASTSMERLGARMAPHERGTICEGFTIRKLRWAYVPAYAASIFLLLYVIKTGFSSHTLPGWRNASIGPELALGAAVSLWTWTKNIRVGYISFNKTKVIRKRRPSGGPTTIAVIVVHGIGSQKAGRPLHSIADPIEHFLDKQFPVQVAVRNYIEKTSEQKYVEFLYEIKGKGRRIKQKVAITEVLWASNTHRPNGLKTFGWFIWSFPMLVALAFAPDRYDLAHGNTVRLVYRIVFPLVLILSILQPSIRPWALLAGLALILSTIFPKTNLLGDVQMAATADREVARITDSINTAIDAALAFADRVVLVGHSQGDIWATLPSKSARKEG